MPRVTIIGAGLAGSLLAIYLAKRGIEVDVYEARGEMRLEQVDAGRSINLALSDRGITALRQVGMDEYMLAEAVPMYGRMVHAPTGDTKLLPYSGRKGEYINSVSRAGLNIALLSEAEKYPGARFHFNMRCADFDCGSGEARFDSGTIVTNDTTIATDGAGSAVRQSMKEQMPNFIESSIFLEHGYKELHIPPRAGDHQLEKNALHIWPRHRFMMIALPNFDGSFTCTLFLAHKGENLSGNEGAPREGESSQCTRPTGRVSASTAAFDQLTDDASVLAFFEKEFPDAVPLMPTLVEDFFHNPTGNLGTIKCSPWNVNGKALLLGDAAHAMVPFYGQGMNCAFEDVRVLASLIDENGPDWQTTFADFEEQRKPNADAICDMAEENFYEMRDAVADPVFQRKRELETKLEQTYPDYFSKYSMVTFREDMPYAEAKARGNAQDQHLMKICSEISSANDLDLDHVIESVRRAN